MKELLQNLAIDTVKFGEIEEKAGFTKENELKAYFEIQVKNLIMEEKSDFCFFENLIES